MRMNLKNMPLRYGLALAVSYPVFFLCVRVWAMEAGMGPTSESSADYGRDLHTLHNIARSGNREAHFLDAAAPWLAVQVMTGFSNELVKIDDALPQPRRHLVRGLLQAAGADAAQRLVAVIKQPGFGR